MKRIRLQKARKRRYCGYDHDQITDLMIRLCDLEDDVLLTEDEQEAMDIAIQALCSIHNAMVGSGKVAFDD